MIFQERHVNKETNKAKPNAFLPYKHVKLSVIRHRDITEAEVWEIGQEVSKLRNLPLIGRGDFLASVARGQGLDVVPDEGEGIPRNHANVVGWPADRPTQMMKALEIAASASYVPAPKS